jgi:L-ornithine N5-oxygenase
MQEERMTHQDVELLAIGAGPSNLALAVAIDELAPPELATNTLVIDRDETISWQRGMLIPGALSQVSFLKDLVTLRNPQSRFSFINYLHENGKLNDFVNMGSFLPFREEIADYFRWAAESLTQVRLECGRECVGIEPQRATDGDVTRWLVHLADGSTIGCRFLVIGAGRDPLVPEVFADLPPERMIHSTRYLQRIREVRPDQARRVAVVGGAQSAAEMFDAVQRDLPDCQPTMIMRSIGLSGYESSKFTNELYFPSFVDDFFDALPAARDQILQEMHRTNYAGLAPGTIDGLYRQLYLDRLHGSGRLGMITMVEVTGAEYVNDEVVLQLTDRKNGAVREFATDLVLLGTGFVRQMPLIIQELGSSLGLDRIRVTRRYRLVQDRTTTAACYLQGVNEATHGIADSLLSVLAVRAHEIVTDIFAHRADKDPADAAFGDASLGAVAVSRPW